MVEQDAKCPGCGYLLEDTTHPDSEGAYDATARRCFACVERERMAATFREHGASTAGLLVSVTDLREED